MNPVTVAVLICAFTTPRATHNNSIEDQILAKRFISFSLRVPPCSAVINAHERQRNLIPMLKDNRRAHIGQMPYIRRKNFGGLSLTKALE
jgi:hypothetical protein